jgi:DDE family transposase
VVAAFDGGTVSSDAGALLLGRTDEAIGLIDRLAGCFIDERNPDLIHGQDADRAARRMALSRIFEPFFTTKTGGERAGGGHRAQSHLEELDRVSNPGAPYPKWMGVDPPLRLESMG